MGKRHEDCSDGYRIWGCIRCSRSLGCKTMEQTMRSCVLSHCRHNRKCEDKTCPYFKSALPDPQSTSPEVRRLRVEYQGSLGPDVRAVIYHGNGFSIVYAWSYRRAIKKAGRFLKHIGADPDIAYRDAK